MVNRFYTTYTGMHGVTESTDCAMVSWWDYVDIMLILRSTVKTTI